VDVLNSISRVMIDIVDSEHKVKANQILNILATYSKAEDLINIGAYVKGSNPEVDYAIDMIGKVNAFLMQEIDENVGFAESKRDMLALFA
jgi:flagellum-specific ATP synthase